MTANNKLLEILFKYGLGEHLILHVQKERSMLGKLVYDKGRMLLKDNDYLVGFKPEFLKPC